MRKFQLIHKCTRDNYLYRYLGILWYYEIQQRIRTIYNIVC